MSHKSGECEGFSIESGNRDCVPHSDVPRQFSTVPGDRVTWREPLKYHDPRDRTHRYFASDRAIDFVVGETAQCDRLPIPFEHPSTQPLLAIYSVILA